MHKAEALQSQFFPYAEERAGFLGLLIGISGLSFIELIFFGLLFRAFIKNITTVWIIVGVLAVLYIWLVLRMMTVLDTQHELTETELKLRYGAGFKCDIPRALLVSASTCEAEVGLLIGRARFDEEKQQVNIAFSPKGQLLLTLHKPILCQLSHVKQRMVESVLLNVDEPDKLLTALNLPEAAKAGEAPEAESVPVNRLPVATAFDREEMAAIELTDLTCNYGEKSAVSSLDLTVFAGEIFGFLGPNGAGKTSTIKMMVGLLRPTAGTCAFNGINVWQSPLEAKLQFGYVADRAILYERLTGREFLQFIGQLRSLPFDFTEARIAKLLELLELDSEADRLCGQYSLGMKRKLALAAALLPEPPILVLDEPLSGLDPLSAYKIKQLFQTLASEGTTIFLSSHDLPTIELLCHRVGILHQGQLVMMGRPADLRQQLSAPNLEALFLSITAGKS